MKVMNTMNFLLLTLCTLLILPKDIHAKGKEKNIFED